MADEERFLMAVRPHWRTLAEKAPQAAGAARWIFVSELKLRPPKNQERLIESLCEDDLRSSAALARSDGERMGRRHWRTLAEKAPRAAGAARWIFMSELKLRPPKRKGWGTRGRTSVVKGGG